jgi:protein-disulfide isomerase
MRLRLFGVALLALTLFTIGISIPASAMSADESARLVKFFQNRFGANMPPGTEITVKSDKTSILKGLQTGNFVIKTSDGQTQDVAFVASKDGKYVLVGSMGDTKTFEDTPIKDLKKGSIPMARGEFPIFVSADGQHMIVGNEIISTKGFKESKLAGLKEGTFNMGNREVPIFVSSTGQYLILDVTGGGIYDSTIDPHKEVMEKISLENVPTKGAEGATVTVVEYSDFQCPFCKRAKDMLPEILKTYDGKIKIAYKQLPLRNHDWAKPAAIASICAYQQGNDKFWEFHDMVFDNQKEIKLETSEKMFKGYAKDLGLDSKKFDACLVDKKVSARVDSEVEEAISIGVQSTPTFIVNGVIVQGANPDGLKSAIELKLSEGS